jgi:hypothetical protein
MSRTLGWVSKRIEQLQGQQEQERLVDGISFFA